MKNNKCSLLIKEIVKEIILEKAGVPKDYVHSLNDIEDIEYETIARILVMNHEDGTPLQDFYKLVDNYVRSVKQTSGVSLDVEKLYNEVVKQLNVFIDSTNIRTYGGR